MRKLALLLAVLLALGLGGCGETPPASPEPPAESQPELPVSREGQVGLALDSKAGLEPYDCTSSMNRLILSLLYEPLFRVNADYSVQPVLAESWTVSIDGRTTTVQLCDDLSFSDGSALTADDAVLSLQLAQQSRLYGSRLRHLKKLRAADERTLVLTTDVPYECLPRLLDVPIIRQNGEDVQPLGTGPYVPEGEFLLRRREEKYCPLTAKTIFLRPVENTEELRSGFQAGSVSLLVSDPNGDTPLLLKEAPNIWSVPTTELLYLGFNLGSPVFSSGSIRSAVSYAIDRDALVSETLNDFATATAFTVPPDSPWYLQELADSVAYEPERLRNVVAPGTEISLLISTEHPRRQAVAERIAEELDACGFQVKLNVFPPKAYAEALKACNFDLYLGQIRLSPDLDMEPLFTADSGVCFGGLDSLPQLRHYCKLMRTNHGNSDKLQNSVLLDGVLCPLAFMENALCSRAEAKGDFKPCIDRAIA